MEKYLIRTEIMNLTLTNWEKIHEAEKVGFIECTVKELIELIGFTGVFFSGKVNERELRFIDEFYNYGRGMAKPKHIVRVFPISDVVESVCEHLETQHMGICVACGHGEDSDMLGD